MTLKCISDTLNQNIEDNAGTRKLATDTISSAQITALFDQYLLHGDLIIINAVINEDTESVTVSGDGNSFIFFGTTIDALRFTLDSDSNPLMSVHANAIIKPENGWNFGKSFPVLQYGNWGGYYDPANTARSEEHTSELQSLMRISYAVFCLKK